MRRAFLAEPTPIGCRPAGVRLFQIVRSMKQAIKWLLTRIPGGVRIRRALNYYRTKWKLRHFKNIEALFTHYYRENVWGDNESVSGSGSTIKYTENIRKRVPVLLEQLDVRRILDAPCGDYNWFRLIPIKNNIHYMGGDIVEPLITRNQSLYGNENTEFFKLDITRNRLPQADLWICRDCLFHFSNEMIFRTLVNFLKSDIRYFLTSIYPECQFNTDIATGSFRFLNLQLPPFDFSKPLLLIDDWIEGCTVRQMGLWERETLSRTLFSNKALQRTSSFPRIWLPQRGHG